MNVQGFSVLSGSPRICLMFFLFLRDVHKSLRIFSYSSGSLRGLPVDDTRTREGAAEGGAAKGGAADFCRTF